MGRIDELQVFLNRIQSNIAKDSDYLSAMAILAKEDNYPKILSLAQNGRALFPNNGIFDYWFSLSNYKTGNIEMAFDTIVIAIGKTPEHKDSILLALDLARITNETGSLISFFKLALEQLPNNPDVLEKIRDFFANNPELVNENTDLLMKTYLNGKKEAGELLFDKLYFEKADAPEALDIFIENYEKKKSDEDFLKFLVLGIIKSSRKDPKAINALREIYKAGFKYKDVISYLADFFASKGVWDDESQIICENAVALKIASFNVYKFLAQKYMMLQLKDEDSLEIIFGFFVHESDNKDTIAYLIPYIIKKDKFTEEERAFLKIAFKLYPENFDIFKKLVENLLFTPEEVIDNLSLLQKYLEENPNSESAIRLLGNSYLKLGRRDSEALFIYENLVRFEPENEELIRILTEYYLSENRKSRLAIIIYEKAFSMGIKSVPLYKLLSDYYIEKNLVNNDNISVFQFVYEDIRQVREHYSEFLGLLLGSIKEGKVKLEANEFFFDVLRDIIDILGDENYLNEFLKYAVEFKRIDNDSLALYKKLYDKKKDDKDFITLLSECYFSRNVLDDTGREVFEKLFPSFEGDKKQKAILLLSQFYVDNKVRNDFSSEIISWSNELVSKGIKHEGNLERMVQFAVKHGKQDLETLELLTHYLEINKNNAAVYQAAMNITIAQRIYEKKYIGIAKRALSFYPEWPDLFNYYAVLLAENKVRDDDTYAIWEKYLLRGGEADVIIFELLSYYINNRTIDSKAEKVIKIAISKEYKNAQILLQYARCLAKSGNFTELIKVLVEVINYEITAAPDVKFIADNLMLFAKFDILNKFLDKYSEKSRTIMGYRIRNLFYSDQLDKYENYLVAYVKNAEMIPENADVFEIFGDHFFYIKNDPRKAMLGYEYYLNVYANDPLVLYKASLCSIANGDLYSALKYIKKLLLFRESDIEALKIAANIHLELGQYDEAAQLYKKIQSGGYNDFQILKNYAEALFKSGQYFSAVDILREILTENPDDTEIMLKLAYAYTYIDFKEDAIHTLERTIELDPLNREAIFSLFSICLEDQRCDAKAQRIYEMVLTLDPKNMDSGKMLSRIYAINGRNDERAFAVYKFSFSYGEPLPEVVKILANRAIEKNADLEKDFAIEVLKNAVDFFPSNTKYWSTLIDLLVGEFELEQYADFFERSFKKEIRVADCAEKLAEIFFERKDLDKALFYSVAALNQNPYKSNIYNLMGEIYIIRGDMEKAREVLEKAINYEQNGFAAYVNYANVMYELKNAPLALANLEKALKINSYYLPAVLKYASIAAEKNAELEKAKEYLRFIKEIYQKNWSIPYWLSVLNKKLGDYDIAVANAKEALEIEKNEEIVLLYSELLWESGNREDAINFLMPYREMNSPRIFTALGKYYFQKQDFDNAKLNFGQSMSIDQKDVDTQIEMGKLQYYVDKDMEAAQVAFQNIFDFDPENAEAKRFLGKIHFARKQLDKSYEYYNQVLEFLDEEDQNYLTMINFQNERYEDVLQIGPQLLRKNPDNIKILYILFRTYKKLNLYEQAIATFNKLRLKSSEAAQELFGEFFAILLETGDVTGLRKELITLTKDPKVKGNYSEYFFFIEYLLYQTDYNEIKYVLPDVLKAKEETADFKKNKSLMLLHILLFENDLAAIDKFIHFFNRADETIKFLTAIFQHKSGRQESAIMNFKDTHIFWDKPFFYRFLKLFKDSGALKHLKESYRFSLILDILRIDEAYSDLEGWIELFISFAEDRLGEKFADKNIDKALKNLLARMERYEHIEGKQQDINTDLVLHVTQIFNFTKKNYKEAKKISQKYTKDGLLFCKAFYEEAMKKKIDTKKLLRVISENLLKEEIPFFVSFLIQHNIPELIKIKMLDEAKEPLGEAEIAILFDLYKTGLFEDSESLREKLKTSNSYYMRYLVYNSRFEEAYELVKKMHYFEFISLENSKYIMEVLRINEDYDQLLSYKFRFFEKTFIDDDFQLYYAVSLSKFTLVDNALKILSSVNYSEVSFLSAIASVTDNDQVPGDAVIDSYIASSPRPEAVFELVNFAKDYRKDVFLKHEEHLREILSPEDFELLKGRTLFMEGKYSEAAVFLKKSDRPQDFMCVSSFLTPEENKAILKRTLSYVESRIGYFSKYESFLPFSYKGIFLHKSAEDLHRLRYTLYGIYSDGSELDQQLLVGEEIVSATPDQMEIYSGIYFIYKDFKKDYGKALHILNKLLTANPEDSKLIIEKAKLLNEEGRVDYALNFLLAQEKKTRDILAFTAELYESKKMFIDAIGIYSQLYDIYKEREIFEKIISLKYDLNLYADLIDSVGKSGLNSDMLFYYTGMSFHKTGEYRRSNEMLTRVNPDFQFKDTVSITLGLNSFNLKEFEKSKGAFSKAIQKKMNEDIAWAKLAEILYANGENANAAKALEKAFKVGINDPTVHLLAAELYFTMNKKSELVKELRFLTKNPLPDEAQYHLRYGSVLYKTGKNDKAETEFLRVLDLENDNSEALKYLTEIYLKEEAYLKCLPIVQRAYEEDPVKNALSYSIALYSTGEYAKAKEIVKNISSDDETVYLLKGKLYYELKSYEEAQARFQIILSKNPKNFEAQLYMGKVYSAQFKIQQALQHLKIAESLNENNFEVLKFLGLCYNKLSDTINTIIFLRKALTVKPNDHETIVELAQLYFNKKRYREAIKEFNKAINIKFNIPQSHFQLAKAYRNVGDLSNAETAIKNALDLDPKEEVFLEEKINILKLKSNFSEICKTLEQFEQGGGPLSPKFMMHKVEGLRMTNRFDNALTEIGKYEFPAPLKRDVEKEKALTLYQLQRYDEALVILEKLYKEIPEDKLFIPLCLSHLEKDNITRVKQILKGYKGELFKSEIIPYILGYIEKKEGNKEIALNYFYQAITVNKGFVRAYRELSEIYFKNRNYIMAADIIHNALKYEKVKKMDFFYYLGICYMNLNEYPKALKYMKEALAWDYQDSGHYISQIYKKLGLWGFALITIKRLLLENRMKSEIAWPDIIYYLFRMGRRTDAVIESFFHLSEIKDEEIMKEFLMTLLEDYEKPFSVYLIVSPGLDISLKNETMLAIYLEAVSGIDNLPEIKDTVKKIEATFANAEAPRLFEALGVYHYKKNDPSKASTYLKKAIDLNPDLEKAIYFLSLMK